MTPRGFLGLLTLLLATPALGQSGSIPGALELYPAINSIGARMQYSGDDNGNASARLEWRRSGGEMWWEGVALTRISNRRWAGSVLWLEPNTLYDVRVTIEDPDGGGTATGTVRTRDDAPIPVSGRTWWVSTTGNDAAAGTAQAPLRTLQAAVVRAEPGDEIRVRPGIYYETVEPPRSGSPSAPIHLTAEGPGVVLDGSDPALLVRVDWRDDGGGVFSIPFAGSTRLVCADSLQRLYHHASVTALRSGAHGVAQGWVAEGGRLWVRLEGGDSPAGHVMHVARFNVGVHLEVDHWHVSGFEIRYFGTALGGCGVYLRGADGCRVADNHVHTIGGRGIYLRALASDNLIERNLCRDPRIGTWPWGAVKGHEEEVQGISHRGGRGNVIRRNTVRGFFDGIDLAGGESDENVGADCDVSENSVHGVGDDALEPESIAGINVRVWMNRVDDVFNGVSSAPCYQGPMYILYNTLTNYRRGGFKFSLSGTGHIWICHNTLSTSVPGTSAVHPTGPYSNVHFRNNVLTGNGKPAVSDDAGESQTGNDFDGDLLHSNVTTLFRWKGVNYSSLSALRSATGFEQAGGSGDPLFASPENGDYTLSAGSPAIDRALRLPGINDGFFGAGPDVGAHEFGADGPDTTPPAAITDLDVQG